MDSSQPLFENYDFSYIFKLGGQSPSVIKRISSGIAGLDAALGGGFGQGEATLVVAGQGAGKTVMATQLAGTFASQHKTGLLITIDQRHTELEPRIVSNFGNIPFATIKDGIDESRLPPDIVRRIESVKANLSPFLYFCNWSAYKGHSIVNTLDMELASFVHKHGKIDWLVVDSIGGAVNELSDEALRVLLHEAYTVRRAIYKAAADHLCVIAEKYNMPVVAFTQASVVRAKNKSRVDDTMIADNRQMGEQFTNDLGISALEAPFDPNDTKPGAAVYPERQFINIWKARKSAGGLIPVKREFDYQRFGEIGQT